METPKSNMDGLLQSLQSEMRVARSESCQLAKTMWTMFSAFEGVVDDMSPYADEYKESPFFKRSGQRNSMFSGKMVPIWNSEQDSQNQSPCFKMSQSCPNTTIETSSVPNSPFLSQKVLGIKTSLSVSNPVLSTCREDDQIKILVDRPNCALIGKDSFLHVSDSGHGIYHKESEYSDWIVDEINQLRTGDANTITKSDDEEASVTSSGYNTRECSPTQYKEEDIDLLFREKYCNYREQKPGVINLESNIDHVCNNIYANLRHFDNAILEECNFIMPNHTKSSADRSCADASGGFLSSSNSEVDNTSQSISDLKKDFTLQNLTKAATKRQYTSVEPSVVELTPKKSVPEHLKCSSASIITDCESQESDIKDPELCFPHKSSNLHQIDASMLEDYELDAEVAYIMSRNIENGHYNENKAVRKTDVLGKPRTPRRPSISSDAADSGRGSWVSPRSHSEINDSSRRDSGVSMMDLPFKPVEHVYETIPGDDCGTPVTNKWQVDLDTLVESNVDQEPEPTHESMDNTYASLNVSKMMNDFYSVPKTPPRLPARRYSSGESRRIKHTSYAIPTGPQTTRHRNEAPTSTKSVSSIPEYDEVIGSDHHHTYTIADVMESVENFAGHLPKARGNLYSLIQNRRARRRLSECLRKSVPTGFVTAERSPKRSAYAEHQKVAIERRRQSNVGNNSNLSHKRPEVHESNLSPPKPPRLSDVEKFSTMFDEEQNSDRSTRKSHKRGRHSLPAQQVTSPIKPRRPSRPVWNYELLKSHAIYC